MVVEHYVRYCAQQAGLDKSTSVQRREDRVGGHCICHNLASR